MCDLYRPNQPGDILRLHVPIGDIEPDMYVLLSIDDTCCLVLLGENEQGQLCATSSLVDVSLAELSMFIETGMRMQPLL
jgi:hypothetical protein